MIGTFLRGKAFWEQRNPREGLACLKEMLGDGDALYVPDRVLGSRTELPYELFISGMLASDDHLVIPFATAVTRLWDAFPAQYAIDALELRQLASGDLGAPELEWLYAAAGQGLVSADSGDYGRVATVVVRAEDQPHLAEVLDASRLEAQIAAAAEGAARGGFIAGHRDLVANLFLDAVFHRWLVMDRTAALSGLDRVAASEPALLDLVAETLAAYPHEHAEIARVGMRAVSGSAACVTSLVTALRARDFDSLAEDCLPQR